MLSGRFFRYHKDGQSLLILLPSEEPEMIKVNTKDSNGVSPNLLKEKCISEVVRIGSMIIFHLSKL